MLFWARSLPPLKLIYKAFIGVVKIDKNKIKIVHINEEWGMDKFKIQFHLIKFSVWLKMMKSVFQLKRCPLWLWYFFKFGKLVFSPVHHHSIMLNHHNFEHLWRWGECQYRYLYIYDGGGGLFLVVHISRTIKTRAKCRYFNILIANSLNSIFFSCIS